MVGPPAGNLDETLKAIKAAGYAWKGLLTRTTTDPFIAADATPEYLDGLKRSWRAPSRWTSSPAPSATGG